MRGQGFVVTHARGIGVRGAHLSNTAKGGAAPVGDGTKLGQPPAALRSGELKPGDVPIQYIVRDGQALILNTRSAQALEQAGIPRSQWYAVNMTGDAAAEARLAGQLQRNNLTS